MVKKKHPGKPLAQRLGTQISTLRKTKEWTQADLAERIGVEPETISRFERGATTPPPYRHSKRSAIACACA